MKGLAALVLEGLDAARAVGAEEWLRAQMADELGPDGAALVDRLVDGIDACTPCAASTRCATPWRCSSRRDSPPT